MFRVLRNRIRRLCSRLRRLFWFWRRAKPKVVIRRFGKLNSKARGRGKRYGVAAERPIRVATFNVALFTLAPAIPTSAEKSVAFIHEDDQDYMKIDQLVKSSSDSRYPKSILKQSPLHPATAPACDELQSPNASRVVRSKPKVSINLPENEISLAQNKVLSIVEDDPSKTTAKFSSINPNNSLAPLMRSPIYFPAGNGMPSWMNDGSLIGSNCKTIFDVLKEVDADIFALQDVKAEEERNMTPLSDLAEALGMNYVFAESWAPEYGNAILSKWPIKKWKVEKIYDDKDFRNVLKATIDIPWMGELNFYCTQLDHLDENWRMKQIDAIIQSSNHQPHILAGGINSLDCSDYSAERWMNIVKYYEEIGKPTPKAEVMNFLKHKEYTDAKEFPGECEPVVIIAKGQSVQGTCKYGTRVDYILASPELGYEFVPGSYSVVSSKGTSDHHIVKVDIVKANKIAKRSTKRFNRLKNRVALGHY